MSRQLVCSVHGENEATIVCAHIVDTLRDERPRGFLWSLDQDNEYQAVCAACNDMSRAEFDRRAEELGRVLCFACYQKVAMLNGIEIKTDGGALQ